MLAVRQIPPYSGKCPGKPHHCCVKSSYNITYDAWFLSFRQLFVVIISFALILAASMCFSAVLKMSCVTCNHDHINTCGFIKYILGAARQAFCPKIPRYYFKFVQSYHHGACSTCNWCFSLSLLVLNSQLCKWSWWADTYYNCNYITFLLTAVR